MAVLPGGAHVVVGDGEGPLSCGRSTASSSAPSKMGCYLGCVAALPDGVHFVVGMEDYDGDDSGTGVVGLYHVDGTLVHTFKGHTDFVMRWR